jgi:hypothetical protein
VQSQNSRITRWTSNSAEPASVTHPPSPTGAGACSADDRRKGLRPRRSSWVGAETAVAGRPDQLIEQAQAVRLWLEMTSHCECESLEVCSLFDERVVGLRSRAAHAGNVRLLELPSG